MAAAITTTFTGPPPCAQSVGGLTMLQDDAYRIWLNAPIPVPGVTISSCYPPQFMSSFLLQNAGTSQPALSPLVCPSGYATQAKYANNYIACCPSNWDGLALAANAPTDRPASGATCYTNIYNVPISVTSYDATAAQAASIFLPTSVSAQAYAYAWEGFAYQGGSGGGATNGAAKTTSQNAQGNGNGNQATATQLSSAGGDGAKGGSSMTTGGTTSASNIAQAENTGSGSNTATDSGSESGGEYSPSKTSGGTGGTLFNSATEARSTSTITTISSPGSVASIAAEKLSSGTIAAIVIGAILALLLLIAIGLFALNYRQRRMAEKKDPIAIYNTNYHSHYWWMGIVSGRSRRDRDRGGGGEGGGMALTGGGSRWPGWRGEKRESKTYHELEGQRDGHDRKNATELQGSRVERPDTYEMEARITKV